VVVSALQNQRFGCQHTDSGCVGSVVFSGWWHLNQHFLKHLAPGHSESYTEQQGGSDAGVSHVNTRKCHCMKYFYTEFVKDEGVRRKLLHYLIADKVGWKGWSCWIVDSEDFWQSGTTTERQIESTQEIPDHSPVKAALFSLRRCCLQSSQAEQEWSTCNPEQLF